VTGNGQAPRAAPAPPWVQALTAGVIGLTALGVVAGLVVVFTAQGVRVPAVETDRARLEDIVLFRRHPPPLAPDGRLDVYAILGRTMSPEHIREVCTSARSGEGPTADEIEADDYLHFPYQRYRGEPQELDTLVLWDRAPTDGERLVARWDGTVFTVSEAAMQDFFAANPGQE